MRKESKVLVDSLNNLNEKMKKFKKESNLHEHNIDHENHYTYFQDKFTASKPILSDTEIDSL